MDVSSGSSSTFHSRNIIYSAFINRSNLRLPSALVSNVLQCLPLRKGSLHRYAKCMFVIFSMPFYSGMCPSNSAPPCGCSGVLSRRYVAQFTFTHDALIRIVDASHAILELAVALWQFFSDDVCASRNVLA